MLSVKNLLLKMQHGTKHFFLNFWNIYSNAFIRLDQILQWTETNPLEGGSYQFCIYRLMFGKLSSDCSQSHGNK